MTPKLKAAHPDTPLPCRSAPSSGGKLSDALEQAFFQKITPSVAFSIPRAWPTVCRPQELIDRLISSMTGPFQFYCWNDDLLQPLLTEESAACALSLPSHPWQERHFQTAACDELRRAFFRIRPKRIWLAWYGTIVFMNAYELAADGNYRLLPVSEAQRINSQATRWWGEADISMAAMAHMICSPNDHETVVFFSAAGEDITDSVLPNSLLSSLSPQDTEPVLRALERRRPAYLRFGNFLANFWNDRYYILQENGSYRVGSNPMTTILETRSRDPLYRKLLQERYRRHEE